jgi:hypothetical protein
MQPQGHVQVLCNMIDFGMTPQARATPHVCPTAGCVDPANVASILRLLVCSGVPHGENSVHMRGWLPWRFDGAW